MKNHRAGHQVVHFTCHQTHLTRSVRATSFLLLVPTQRGLICGGIGIWSLGHVLLSVRAIRSLQFEGTAYLRASRPCTLPSFAASPPYPAFAACAPLSVDECNDERIRTAQSESCLSVWEDLILTILVKHCHWRHRATAMILNEL
ncbi:hypothetical protein BAUCODRAFT_246219 [Baudoinia panamericana UAMH 10762]|uniref:Uncharacterized protein n=1 Tax=Baudoinia panamericana (strain UAMH 10762) TaxID=717646 RepID=M2MAU4_BAUPA|nr:uncharacterized protein BAUCODRAFT_246219 [Baudoinia panamericana UAMH 10762]EMC93586.1 hypothetical protein BAUCODRAFT_246219 [Baudoinia panamericana UAMH 10762]